MVFHWCLSDSKSLQVSGTCLSILAVLSNAVVWIISTRPPISKSSRPFNNTLVTVPNAPIKIGTIVTFMFHSIFISLARSRYLSLLFTFLQIYSVVRRDSKVDNFAESLFFFLLIIMKSGLLAGIKWSVCMLKSHSSLCVSFFRTGAGLCIYHLFVRSNWNLLLLFTSLEFFTSVLADGFSHWSLSDSKSPQVSRTRLSILAVLSNAVVWIVR